MLKKKCEEGFGVAFYKVKNEASNYTARCKSVDTVAR